MAPQTFEGRFRASARTIAQHEEAKRLLGGGAGVLVVTQGGYNVGGVAASAGTHDRDGCIDYSVRGLTRTQINARVRALRTVGLWAWYRPELWRSGRLIWGPHIHCVSVGCKDLAPLAASQIRDARNGRDGLAGHGPDPHRGMGLPVVTWEQYKAAKAQAEARARAAEKAKAEAAKTKASPKPKPKVDHAPGSRTIKRGSVGYDVKVLQRFLGVAVDGKFGPVTEAALRRWERRTGRDVNGVVGEANWKVIVVELAKRAAAAKAKARRAA